MTILLTGIAGFIGFHLARRLVKDDLLIVGIDNLNAYYDLKLKFARLTELGIDINQITEDKPIASKKFSNLVFIKSDIEHYDRTEEIFKTYSINKVVHLAAQVGVRYSLENPRVYIASNITGFFNVLENARRFGVEHFIFASSSSVYGNQKTVPYSEKMCVNSPVSLYAATKIADEALAKSYSVLYDMKITGLRFFTVYGPWGRPDMSYYLFTKWILDGQPIKLFNKGELKRDFTYVEDISEAMAKITRDFKQAAAFDVFNIGSGKETKVIDMVRLLEEILGKKAVLEFLPMQKGDVYHTLADITKLKQLYQFSPKYDLRSGLKRFTDWYKNYHNKLK